MADLHRLPSIEAAEREASDWIARLNADDVCAEDRAQFETWRKAHPRHARAYEELTATWRQFTDAGEVVRAVAFGQALNVTTQAAIRQSTGAAADSSPTSATHIRGATPSNLRRAVIMAAAASVAALALGGWWWLDAMHPRTQFQTAIGERASIELPDGSSVELNSNSRARVDYSEQARVIRLERGEAYFQVEHDTARPFWVVAGRSWVRAVGTAFNVYVRDDGVRVTVSEGKVKVAAPSSGSLRPSDLALAAEAVSVLAAGEQVHVSAAASEVRALPPVELTRSIAWRTGTLYFENRPLGEVVDELSRYTMLRLVIEDPSLEGLPVGGTFKSDPEGAEALLALLQDGFGLRVRRAGDTAHIEAAGATD